MKSPLVSAVIVMREEMPFLQEALQSVWDQTYDRIETVLIHDGKPDERVEQIRRWPRDRNRTIRFVALKRPSSNGSNSARQLAVKRSQGEFIGFLDPDEVWQPTKVAEQVGVLQRFPQAVLVCGQTQIWHSWHPRARHGDDHFLDLGVVPERLYHPPDLLTHWLIHPPPFPAITNSMIRKRDFEQVGGFEDSLGLRWEDHQLLAKLYLHGVCYISNASWVRRRQSAHGRMRFPKRSYVAYYRRQRPLLEWLQTYVAQTSHAEDSQLVSLLQQEVFAARHPFWSAFKRRAIRSSRR